MVDYVEKGKLIHVHVDGKPVGGVTLEPRTYVVDGEEIEVLAVANIRLLKAARGLGLGKGLYQRALEKAKALGLLLASDTSLEPVPLALWGRWVKAGKAREVQVDKGRWWGGRAYMMKEQTGTAATPMEPVRPMKGGMVKMKDLMPWCRKWSAPDKNGVRTCLQPDKRVGRLRDV